MTNVFEPSNVEIVAYKDKFKEVVIDMEATPRQDLVPIDERNWEVESLLSEYIEFTGSRPDNEDLHRLSNYILADSLRNPRPYKTANEDYPIQSQYSRQMTPTREVSMEGDILDYLNSKYSLRIDSLYRVSSDNKGES